MNVQTRERAESVFKRKEEARLEGDKAMADYRASQAAMREKTARLRALRLARDEANKSMAASKKRKAKSSWRTALIRRLAAQDSITSCSRTDELTWSIVVVRGVQLLNLFSTNGVSQRYLRIMNCRLRTAR
jgi:hypothetical protein